MDPSTVINLTGLPNTEASFVAKIDANGTFQWAFPILPFFSGNSAWVNKITTNENNEIFVAVVSSGNIVLGGGVYGNPPAGSNFIVKLQETAVGPTVAWVYELGCGAFVTSMVAFQDQVVVLGDVDLVPCTATGLPFDPFPNISPQPIYIGSGDVFILEINNTLGNPTYVNAIGSVGFDQSFDIHVNSTRTDIYATAIVGGAARISDPNLGGNPVIIPTQSAFPTNYNALYVKYPLINGSLQNSLQPPIGQMYSAFGWIGEIRSDLTCSDHLVSTITYGGTLLLTPTFSITSSNSSDVVIFKHSGIDLTEISRNNVLTPSIWEEVMDLKTNPVTNNFTILGRVGAPLGSIINVLLAQYEDNDPNNTCP